MKIQGNLKKSLEKLVKFWVNTNSLGSLALVGTPRTWNVASRIYVLHYLLLSHVKRLLINEADQEATFPSAEEAQQKLALTGEV